MLKLTLTLLIFFVSQPLLAADHMQLFIRELPTTAHLHQEDGDDDADNHPLSETIKPLPIWTLTAGHTIGKELQTWGEQAGWKIIWNMPKDWAIPASTQFSGEFPTAAAEVIKTLSSNGALIHAQFFEGNKTMVVTGPGVSE